MLLLSTNTIVDDNDITRKPPSLFSIKPHTTTRPHYDVAPEEQKRTKYFLRHARILSNCKN